jgi:myosin-5
METKHSIPTTKLWCYDKRSSWTLNEYTTKTKSKDKKTGKELFTLTLFGDDAKQLNVLQENTAKYNTSHDLDFNDLTRMDDLHEGPVLHLLRRRFEQQRIYTSAGDVLISINPYENINGLYDMPLSEKYSKQSHVFKISERAFSQLNDTQRNQVILVNGESGAGKTEATKKIQEANNKRD